MSDKRLMATVKGRVQGVGFRYFVQHHARRLGIRGWVRNTDQGHVEVDAAAAEKTLEELVLLLRRGPALSRVDEVVYNIIDAEDVHYAFFDIRD